MKKSIFTLLLAASVAGGAMAQTVEESKLLDNWYLGVNAGISARTTHTAIFQNLNPSAGVRLGRNLTPVFGLAIESEVYFNNKGSQLRPLGTFVKGINASVLGTTNLTNWILGYNGQPRLFEVSAIYGAGWAHVFSTKSAYVPDRNALTSKLGLDFTFNLGADKEWQVYIEPNITYALDVTDKVQYNIDHSAFGVLVGVNYKFGNSNGTHNFKIAELRNQAEIDDLNAKINELRADNNAKANAIAIEQKHVKDLEAQLAECNAKKAPVIVQKEETNVLQPTVIFSQGKSTIDAAQYASISMVASYMKRHPEARILVRGYASPEGSKEVNQRISEARAKVVRDALVKRYGIASSRLEVQGMGATDELFEEADFNRVATFTDITNKK